MQTGFEYTFDNFFDDEYIIKNGFLNRDDFNLKYDIYLHTGDYNEYKDVFIQRLIYEFIIIHLEKYLDKLEITDDKIIIEGIIDEEYLNFLEKLLKQRY